MESGKIHVYKISDSLYRVKNPRGITKDVWIDYGRIKEPTNQYDILTETERQLVELELKK